MRTGSKTHQFALDALEAAALGFEILEATRRYRRVLVNEGLEGIRRVIDENRRREMRSWLRAARRARFVEAKRHGDRVRVRLTEKGRLRLLKDRIVTSPRLPGREIVLVAFDFPISQRRARNAFRYFLRTCGFRKIQQSLWFSRHDIEAPLTDFVQRSGSKAWIRLFHTTES